MKIVENVKEFDEILANNTSVVVDFYADWCGPCKMLAPVFEEVANEIEGVSFVKVNVDENIEVAQRYGITTIPTLLAFKNGEKVEQSVGYVPKPNLVKFVSSVK